MSLKNNRLLYHGFGFNIMSEIVIPELNQLQIYDNQPDISIIKKELYDLWLQNDPGNSYFAITDDFIMFHIPDIAYFLVRNGNEIHFSPINDWEEDSLRLYILGICMGVILLQRKILPLHGSAININGKAYAIVGDSGAGKSTLARAFLNRGYQLISDDIVPVSFTEDGIPIVTPSYSQQNLWLDSLNHFGIESEQFKPLADFEMKFSVPISNQFINEPMPLMGIFELRKTESEDISVTAITKMERFHTLFNHTYRNFLLSRANLIDWHFETSVKLVNKVYLYQIHRPLSRFTAYEIAELILNALNKEVTKS